MKKRNFSPSSWLLSWTQYGIMWRAVITQTAPAMSDWIAQHCSMDFCFENVWLLQNSWFTSFHCRGFYPSSQCSTCWQSSCCCWVCLGQSSAPLWNFLQIFRSKQNTLVNGGRNRRGCLTTHNNKSHNNAEPAKLRKNKTSMLLLKTNWSLWCVEVTWAFRLFDKMFIEYTWSFQGIVQL